MQGKEKNGEGAQERKGVQGKTRPGKAQGKERAQGKEMRNGVQGRKGKERGTRKERGLQGKERKGKERKGNERSVGLSEGSMKGRRRGDEEWRWR